MGLIVNVALSCVATEIVSLRLEPFSAFLPLLPPLHFEPFKVLRRRKLDRSSGFIGTTGKNFTVCTPMYTCHERQVYLSTLLLVAYRPTGGPSTAVIRSRASFCFFQR